MSIATDILNGKILSADVQQADILASQNPIHTHKLEAKEIGSLRDYIRLQDEEIVLLKNKIRLLEGNNAVTPLPEQIHTLLYVEDKPESLELIRQIIARHPQCNLLTADNGTLGIKMARSALPEVMLTDINLPDISGFQVLESLRSDPATAHIPVIAISANAMPLSVEKGLEAGFFRYITKPIKLDEFMEALTEVLKILPKANNKAQR